MLRSVYDSFMSNNSVLASLILFCFVLLFRFFCIRFLKNSKLRREERRSWIVQVKNLSVLLFFTGLLFVWGDELRSFAISIVAIAVAIVVATKELILCFMGSIYKTFAKSFRIGDRIFVGHPFNIQGDVVVQDFLSTKLYEIDSQNTLTQYTGKTVVVPNSVFLSSTVTCQNRSGEYHLHTFRVSVSRAENIDFHESSLLAAATDICAPYIIKAKNFFEEIGNEEGLDTPSAEPRIRFSLVQPDRVDFIVRIPVESLKSGFYEHAVLSKYCEKVQAHKEAKQS